MTHISDVRKILFGANRQATLLALGLGGVLGPGAWIAEPLLGVSYWWWPTSPMDWAFVVCFILLATGVAFYRSGFLAACWVSFPAHIVYAHYFYADQFGFVALPIQNDLLFYVLISATFAVFYATIGFLLGTVSRWGRNQLPLIMTETTD